MSLDHQTFQPHLQHRLRTTIPLVHQKIIRRSQVTRKRISESRPDKGIQKNFMMSVSIYSCKLELRSELEWRAFGFILLRCLPD